MGLQAIKITNNFNEIKTEFNDLIKYMNNATSKPININLNINQIQNQFKKMETEASQTQKKIEKTLSETSPKIKLNNVEVDKNATSVIGSLADMASKFGLWYGIAGVVTGVFGAMKDGVSTVVEMESAIVDLNKVVDLTKSQMVEMKDASIELGTALGRSSVDILKSMAEFGRYNKDLDGIKELSRVATMASNVTTLSSEEAAKGLNTAMISFGVNAKDSIKILDSWNELQNNFRVSAEDLSASIGKVGSVSKQTGMDINQLNALTTTLVASMGISGNEAGTAIKSSLSRLYNMGKDGDGGKAQKLLQQYGIQVKSTTGELIPFYNILGQLNERFKTLSTSEKLQIEQAIGGTYHYAKVAQLVEQYGMTLKANESSINSQNSALNENQKYLASTAAKYEQFKVQLQAFANNMVDTDILKGFLTGATELVKVFGNIPSVIGLATTAFLVFKGKAIIGSIDSMIAYQIALGATTTEEALLAGATSTLSLAFNKLKLAFASNPIGMVALGVSALVSVIMLASSKTEDLSKKLSDLTNSMQEVNQTTNLIEKYKELQKQIELNTKVGNDNTELKKQQIEMQKQLAQAFPSAVDGYTKENEAIVSNIKTIEKLNEAKKNQILAEASGTYDKLYDSLANTKTKTYHNRVDGDFEQQIPSLIEKYKQLSEARDKAFSIGDKGAGGKYAKELEPIFKSIEDFNKASIQLYSIGQKDVMYFDMASGKLVKYSDYLAQNTQATNENSNSKNGNANSTINQTQSQEELKKSFDDTTQKIRFYNQVLAEMNTKNGLSANSMKEIMANHSELIPYLDNEAQLHDILSQKVKEEEANQVNAYNKMISASADYYNAKIRNNATAQNAINGALKAMVGNQGNAYSVDLKNYNNLNQLKLDATVKTVKSVAGIWARYYQAESQQFTQDFWRGIMDMSMSSNPAIRQQAAEMERIAKQTQDAVNRMNGVINSVGMPNISFQGLNTEGISAIDRANNEATKSAEDAAKKAEELRKQMESDVKDVESAITEIIKKEFEKRKQAIEDEYNKRKETLQKAKDLYNKSNSEDDYNKKLRTEQEKLNGIKASISSARDNSEAGKLRLRTLQEQEKEQQQAIDQMVLEHTRSRNNDMFDMQMQELDKEKEAKTKSLEEQYSDENIAKMVNQSLITGQISGIGNVLDAYLNFQNKYNQGLTASGKLLEDEFISKWKVVQSLINGTSGVNIGVNFGTLPRYDVGTPNVPKDQMAIIHQGEAVLPKKYNIFNSQGLSNFVNTFIPKTPSISSIRNKNASVNFNEPFVVIQGNVDKGVDLEGIVDRATNNATRKIMQCLNNQGVYEH